MVCQGGYTAPYLYSLFRDDPATDRSFAAFNADVSDHLKLLYCIDMFNEGVRVEDVDGVILLRPTISPIIYKQQIGRALSAGKKKSAVIFDIVMNIENLYSIGAVEEEMKEAIFFYRSHERGEEIVNEEFQVIDEVRDCLELFNKLNDSLTANWNIMYQFAKQYFEENGDLEVPRRHITPEGYALGSWLDVQDNQWEYGYSRALKYHATHGNLNVPTTYVDEEGFALCRWVRRHNEKEPMAPP